VLSNTTKISRLSFSALCKLVLLTDARVQHCSTPVYVLMLYSLMPRGFSAFLETGLAEARNMGASAPGK